MSESEGQVAGPQAPRVRDGRPLAHEVPAQIALCFEHLGVRGVQPFGGDGIAPPGLRPPDALPAGTLGDDLRGQLAVIAVGRGDARQLGKLAGRERPQLRAL